MRDVRTQQGIHRHLKQYDERRKSLDGPPRAAMAGMG
ncbi:hypothetical protein RKD33_003850 [Streptomyces sp. SAI-129]